MAVNILSRRIRNSLYQQFRHGYIVLLPEVSPESGDKNVLIKNGLPVEDLTTEKLVTSFGNTIIEFEHSVRQVEDSLLDDGGGTKTGDIFTNIVEPIEEASVPFESAWGLLKAIRLVDSKLLPPEHFFPLHERARRARYVKFSSHYIYNAFKGCDISKITEEEQRVVAKYLIEGKLNGLELMGDKKVIFSEITHKLAMECAAYHKRIEIAHGLFKHPVYNAKDIGNLPDSIAAAIERDSTLSLSSEIYPEILKYIEDSNLRRSLFLASSHIPPEHPELNNSAPLEEIRSSRQELANLLGYKNYAEMSLETKMANSVEEIYATLDSILDAAMGLQSKEIEELEKFASDCGHRGRLDMSDVPYFAEQHKRKVLGWDEEANAAYFPLEGVLAGLSRILSQGLGVSLVPAPHVHVWHSSASAYTLVDNHLADTVNLGTVIFDPIMRSGKIGGSHTVGIKVGGDSPLVSVIMSLPPPTPDTPSLLTLTQVEALMSKFGVALQQILSHTNYTDVAGTSFIEWDAVNIVPHIMQLCVENDAILSELSGHYKTGNKLSVDDVKAARGHMFGMKLCEELYNAELDLRLHSDNAFWLSIVRDLWPKYRCVSREKDDYSLLFDKRIVLDTPCSTYCKIWAAALAHDVISSSPTGPAVGPFTHRLRETLLSFGGSCHPGEVLRRYLGRDPTPLALIQYIKSR